MEMVKPNLESFEGVVSVYGMAEYYALLASIYHFITIYTAYTSP